MAEYASRAGKKLAHALKKFNISVKDLICADFGCSTGGFTDCLLQNGAKKIYAVDTGYGVLAWKLRNDPRVEVLERTNAMHVSLPEKAKFISVDVSWTKQKYIIPSALKNIAKDGKIVSLIKPHYEAEKFQLTKGKLEDQFVEEVLEKTLEEIRELGATVKNITESPVLGQRGKNKEYLILIQPE